MRRDSAGVVDPALNETQGDEFEAEVSAALDALWRDESERTDVIQPQHMSALVPVFGEVDPEQTTRLPDPEASTREDPGWDDERELTEALDFDRLAPFYVPESEPAPDWALELTTSYDRPAHDAGALDWDDGAELTHRIDHEIEAAVRAASPARGLEFRRDEASTARGLPSGKQQRAATKQRVRGVESASNPRESTIQPRGAKRVGSETLPARGNRPRSNPAQTAGVSHALARPGSWPLSAAQPDSFQLGRAAAGTTSRRPALRSSARPAAGGQRGARASFAQQPMGADHSQPPAARSGPRLAVRAAVPLESLAPAELEGRGELRRVPASVWWLAAGAAFVAVCVAVRVAVSGGIALAPEPVIAAVEAPRPRPEGTGLSLSSHPAGAQIFVDGEATGLITPGRVPNLSPGLHAVELKLAGHYATGLPAVLEQGETLALPQVELQPLPAASIAVEPSSEPAVAAPPRRTSARRWTRHKRTASDLSAAELAVARDPEPAAAADGGGTGLLQINSRPWARILVDGEFVGNTPQLQLRLAAGKHSVRLENEPLHMSKTISVTIRDGETLTKVESLSEDAAHSGVSSQDSDT